MANLIIKRVNELPSVLSSSTLYVIKPAEGGIVTLVFTDNDATASYRTLIKDDIGQSIEEALGTIGTTRVINETNGSIQLGSLGSENIIVNLSSPEVFIDFAPVTKDYVSINAQFIQGDTRSSVVSSTQARLPRGVLTIVDREKSSMTMGCFTTYDKGETWFFEQRGIYSLSASKPLPVITGENAYGAYDPNNLGALTATNGEITASNGIIRFTKGAEAVHGVASMPLDMPAGKDFIFYGRIRMSEGANHSTGFWLTNEAGDYLIFWLNYNPDTGTAPQYRAVQCVGPNVPTFTGAVPAQSSIQWSDFAIQYCSKFQITNIFIRDETNRWKLLQRFVGAQTKYTKMIAQTVQSAPEGTWMEFTTYMVCEPNIMAFGDSICAGSVGYNPDPALGRQNYESTWMRHCLPYPSIKNNLIVNKGVGGTSSAEILASINAELADHAPKAVFVHASTNDAGKSIGSIDRTSNITQSITKVHSVGAEAILLNAMYGTSTNPYNPAMRDYYAAWWDEYADTVGADLTVDIMNPISDGTYMSDSLTDPDKIHPTIEGYTLIGRQIAS